MNIDKGYILAPYIIKNMKTDINGETVWYANKIKNLILKIKHFFIKPKYMEFHNKYMNKSINSSFYEEIKTIDVVEKEIRNILEIKEGEVIKQKDFGIELNNSL